MNKKVAIIGSSGFSIEIYNLTTQCGFTVDCFVEKDNSKNIGKFINKKPVINMKDFLHKKKDVINYVIAIGDNIIRKRLYKDLSFYKKNPVSLVHPSVIFPKNEYISHGSNGLVICSGCIITNNVVIGNNVQINMGSIIAHDVNIGNFVTISPGVKISGNVNIENNVFIGTGSVITNGNYKNPIIIGKNSIVSAGVFVAKNVPEYTKVLGFTSRYITLKQNI